MPKPKKKGAVATPENKEVSTINIGSFLEENAGDGTQNVSTQDLETPRLKLFHGNGSDAPEEARKADIYNNITHLHFFFIGYIVHAFFQVRNT